MNKQSIIGLSSLKKTFGGVVALDSVNLEVQQGSITALIGPNGAGKTTIFNLITGFLSPTEGKIHYLNRSLNGHKPYRIARLGIARTFQNVQVFANMSVLENVMVGRHLRSSAGILSSMILPPFLRREENRIRSQAQDRLSLVGLDALAHRPAGSLPLGNQRMLEIARALSMEPRLLLLDEPASGLNTRETLAMGELISKIRAMGITVILVEHDMDLVMEISDTVAVINFGRLIACAPPAEIQADPEVIAAYLGE